MILFWTVFLFLYLFDNGSIGKDYGILIALNILSAASAGLYAFAAFKKAE
jgi:hypothetical protein